jgi:hypothetical protein
LGQKQKRNLLKRQKGGSLEELKTVGSQSLVVGASKTQWEKKLPAGDN